MILVPEQEIEYITCNIPEQDYELYSSSKNYKTGDKVSVPEHRKNYFATKDIDAGVSPSLLDLKGVKTGWFAETSNRYKMLEKNVYNQSINHELIKFSFFAPNIDTLSFFNLEAKEIYIKISDATTGTVFYEKTQILAENGISLYHYFFIPAWLKDKVSLKLEGTEYENKIADVIDALPVEDIVDRYTVSPPLFFNALIEIEIRRPGLDAKCGKVIVGQGIDLGASLIEGSEVRTKKFGSVKQDEYFGNYDIQEGEVVNQIQAPVALDPKRMDFTLSVLKKYAYKYCLFSLDNFQSPSLMAYGIAEDTSFSPGVYSANYTLKIGSTI